MNTSEFQPPSASRSDPVPAPVSATSPYLAYIGLGSNLGDRERHLTDSLALLVRHPEVGAAGGSPMYETDPIGYLEQDSFLNQVVAVRTSLEPEALYRLMAETELRLGRTRDIRWGPRTLDMDMLLVWRSEPSDPAAGAWLTFDTDSLTVPHPRMLERAFVLIPLVDLVRRLQPEEAGWLERHLDKLEGKGGVQLWKKIKSLNASEHSES
ncbi:2-amino-4-hydroxy-6-hydroxymethyldihydropteridine diphosphokinase [Paenibacillus koleovorans]|uniref:2-amino-4-hydroxy-6- hydroxymethyldihydropteridine diphosphokinase n=1 Tax=Paenibacillus koleovorans TaxID=121608 RepID=UPI0027D8C34C|nr:2-amino-4-hydroxy-6-hydroxymethyldihydropteridine diphosphokinase [Paenibacillus koleovorans]